MNIFIVYCTTCIVNKKIYIGVHKLKGSDFDGYIGCGVYINEPSTYEQSKTIFLRAVKKYGPDKFIRKTIKEYTNEEDAYNLEEELVTEEFLKRSDVYNIVIGGRSGDRGINAKPCYQYDLQGNYLRSFDNRLDASRYVNKGFTTIKRALRDKISGGGYFWSDVKVEKLDLSKYKTSTNRIPIFQYSATGEYDCCYESIADASRCNSTSSHEISNAAKLGILCKNKYFSFEFDVFFSTAKYNYLYEIPVYIYDIHGNFIRESDNLKTLLKELKSKKDLFKYVRLNRVYDDRFQFSFEKLPKLSDRSCKKPFKRKIALYNINGELIKIWDSISDCVKMYGTGVKHCLSGRNKTSKGYTYKYIEEVEDIV